MTTEWFWKESLWSLSGGIMSGAMRGSYLYEMLVGPAPGPALLSIHQRHSQPIKMCPGVQTIWDGQTLANTMGRENVPKSSTKNTIFFYSCKPCTQSPGSLKEAELMCSGGPQVWMIWHDIKLVLFWFTLLGTPCVRSSSYVIFVQERQALTWQQASIKLSTCWDVKSQIHFNEIHESWIWKWSNVSLWRHWGESLGPHTPGSRICSWFCASHTWTGQSQQSWCDPWSQGGYFQVWDLWNGQHFLMQNTEEKLTCRQFADCEGMTELTQPLPCKTGRLEY